MPERTTSARNKQLKLRKKVRRAFPPPASTPGGIVSTPFQGSGHDIRGELFVVAQRSRGRLQGVLVAPIARRLAPRFFHQFVRVPPIEEKEWRELETELGKQLGQTERAQLEEAVHELIATKLFGGLLPSVSELKEELQRIYNLGFLFERALLPFFAPDAYVGSGPSDPGSGEKPDGAQDDLSWLPEHERRAVQLAAEVAEKSDAPHEVWSPQHAVAMYVHQTFPDAPELMQKLENVLEHLSEALKDITARAAKPGVKGDLQLEVFLGQLRAIAKKVGDPAKLPSHNVGEGHSKLNSFMRFTKQAVAIATAKGTAAVSLNSVPAAVAAELLDQWNEALDKSDLALVKHSYAVRLASEKGPQLTD